MHGTLDEFTFENSHKMMEKRKQIGNDPKKKKKNMDFICTNLITFTNIANRKLHFVSYLIFSLANTIKILLLCSTVIVITTINFTLSFMIRIRNRAGPCLVQCGALGSHVVGRGRSI
ncbi:transmembrane protein, putative [Medicago truncatula]|uniref:Transmembrane protein, putative n=1 Tax=Medicago truncatula TaxID=3880 RepID=G7ITM2_MEDTR|nr:transmembrane protein, putative [Medicago truncatula]